MRPTLLPGLLESLRHNLNQGNRDVRLYEIGRIFAGSKAGELPEEREAVALIATGERLRKGGLKRHANSTFTNSKARWKLES